MLGTPRTASILCRLFYVRHLLAAATALTCLIAAWEAHAQSSAQNYDRNACSIHGGVRGIGHQFSYMPFFLRWPVANDGSSPCIRNCPQCIQYCYTYSVVCNDGAEISRLTQVQPFVSPYGDPPTYTSEYQEQAELAQIKAKEASTKFWRPLSPWPQFLILCCFIAVSGIAWVGRYESQNGLKKWSINVPFNLYFALSLFTFNTSGDSNSLAQSLDSSVFFHSGLFVFVVLAFFAINAIPLARGYDYLFVKHPAADIVNSAVSSGAPIDRSAFRQSLSISPRELFQWRPRWYYEHRAEKARKLADMLDRNTELVRATIDHERARAELHDEREESAEEKRERVWRGETL